jgi:hypothetical protein
LASGGRACLAAHGFLAGQFLPAERTRPAPGPAIPPRFHLLLPNVAGRPDRRVLEPPKSRTFAELLIDWEEDRTLRAVLVGMLREIDQAAPTIREASSAVTQPAFAVSARTGDRWPLERNTRRSVMSTSRGGEPEQFHPVAAREPAPHGEPAFDSRLESSPSAAPNWPFGQWPPWVVRPILSP